jgi:cell fate regulator YaaT (PSP1 superfamily)
VLRAATEPDLERIERHRGWEHDALLTCSKKIAAHHLPMHLVDAEFRFDELKLTFYFTAEGRVDFRELVRDLAGAFRTRIELRQIGARDELKRSEGYGVCGQRLCCVNFLCSFQPITTAMAKSQHLILNPIKLSGCCGRLKCCLAFEAENYVGDDGCPCTLQLPSVIDPDARIDHLSD